MEMDPSGAGVDSTMNDELGGQMPPQSPTSSQEAGNDNYFAKLDKFTEGVLELQAEELRKLTGILKGFRASASESVKQIKMASTQVNEINAELMVQKTSLSQFGNVMTSVYGSMGQASSGPSTSAAALRLEHQSILQPESTDEIRDAQAQDPNTENAADDEDMNKETPVQ